MVLQGLTDNRARNRKRHDGTGAGKRGIRHRFVAEVDRRFSLVREAEAQVDANLTRAERLRQSVIQRAFAGGLAIADIPD